MLCEKLWRRRRLEKGDECVVAELRTDFGFRDSGPEEAVCGAMVTREEFGLPTFGKSGEWKDMCRLRQTDP